MLQTKRATAIGVAMLLMMHASAQHTDSTIAGRKVDSLGKAVRSKADRVISGAKSEIGKLTTSPGNLIGDGWKEVKAVGNLKTQLISKVPLFGNAPTFKAKAPSLKAGYTYMKDAVSLSSGPYQALNHVFNYEIHASASLMQLPFNFSFNGYNDVYSFNTPSPESLVKFNFDHRTYLDNIRKQITDKISPDMLLTATTQRIKAIREKYEQQLRGELQELQQSYQQAHKRVLELPASYADLAATDMAKLKSMVLTSSDQEAYQQSLLALKQQAMEGKDITADSSLGNARATIDRLETMKKMYSKILQYKEKFDNNKTVKELQSHLPFTPGKFKEYLKKPGNLEKVVEEYAELSSLQRIFMSITKLDIGQNAASSGDFGMQQLINSGINTEFRNKKASAGFIYGKNNTPNNWLQGGLVNSLSNEYSSVTGFKLGTGSGSPIDQSVSINFYDYKSTDEQDLADVSMRPAYQPTFARRDAVITLHTGYAVARQQWNLDLSKSFGSVGGSSSSGKSDAHSKVFSNEGRSNYAGMLSFDGEVLNSDLRVFVKKVGLGYNNPGNYLLRRGETQVGFGLGKRTLKNKLHLRYSTDFKQQIFDPSKLYRHQAFTNKLQAGFKIKGNNRVNLSYQRSDFHSRLFGDGFISGANSRWQADGAYTAKIGSKQLINNLLVSRQHFDMPMLEDSSYKSDNTLLSYTATTLLKNSPISLTLMLNQSDNKDYLFNTSMFSAETNYTYNVGSMIRLGSGIGYYDNTGWNKQIGGRQQISGTLMNRLDVDIEVSYKKATKVIREEMADQLFITAGLRMNF